MLCLAELGGGGTRPMQPAKNARFESRAAVRLGIYGEMALVCSAVAGPAHVLKCRDGSR